MQNLEVNRSGEIYKPGHGIYRHTKYKDAEESSDVADAVTALPPKKIKEEEFYQSFADWIKNELEECTKAIALGGSKFKDKWGTPDVLGVRESKKSDILPFPTEIVAVEIKLDTGDLITAFGQACSYKIFSHKSYIVVPVEASEGDIARLDALCRIFGIGLILFKSGDPDHPDYQIRVRAAKHEPDMFYVNKNLKLVETELFS